jgi:hypothetical protein
MFVGTQGAGRSGCALPGRIPSHAETANSISPNVEAANCPGVAVSRFIPTHQTKGVELRLVVNGDRGKAQNADPALLKAIARAHRWFDDLVTGRGRLTPHTRGFRHFGGRETLISDSVAERSGFELSVPISKLADDSF